MMPATGKNPTRPPPIASKLSSKPKIVCPLGRMNARPRAIAIAASVTMKGFIRSTVTAMPLNSPQPAPTRIPMATAAGTGTLSCIAIPATTPDKATTEPDERSMPPVMITNVWPQATIAISDVETRIARMLAVDRNEEVVSAR